MDIREDPWLASTTGRAVYRVSWECGPAEELRSHIASQGEGAFYYSKLDTSQVAAARALSSLGFYVVDTSITFGCESPAVASPPDSPEIEILSSKGQAHPGILRVAESAFSYDRFHADPHFPDAIANRIKHNWIENYQLGKRGDQLFVALVDGEPLAFLAALRGPLESRDTATIDLIAVDDSARRRGLGRRLVDHFFRHYRDCDHFQVGTQAANLPSLRFYEALGFRVKKTQFALHLHVGAQPPPASTE